MRGYGDFEDEADQRSFFQRYRLQLGLGALLAIGLGFFIVKITSGGHSSAPRQSPMIVVSLPPPPPVVPTPPPLEQPKMVEQEQTFVPEDKPIEEPPPDEPPIGTNIKGDGSNDSFGLGNKAGNGRLGNSGKGSRFGAYAGQVQARVAEAMRSNRKTREANLSVKVRIWPDVSGRITRAQLAGSSGDPAIDAAIENEVLNGLQLREPPPPGMPTPILLRLTAHRAN